MTAATQIEAGDRAVVCRTDGQTFYSTKHDDRAVTHLPWGGFALYLRQGLEGIRVGVSDPQGAYQWLNGEHEENIHMFKVQPEGMNEGHD